MPTVGKRHRGGLALCALALGLPWLTGRGVAPAYGAQWSICKYFSQLPDDCAGADDSRDSAPKPLTDKLDPKRIAKQYRALAVSMSPPRYWTLDWIADRVG